MNLFKRLRRRKHSFPVTVHTGAGKVVTGYLPVYAERKLSAAKTPAQRRRARKKVLRASKR